MLQAEDFGAIGDGERDDTVALQAALSRAEGSGLRLRARPYAIRDTLLIPTNCVLEGRGAVIHQKSDDKPILASLAWAGRGPTKGYTRILGLACKAPAAASGRTGSSCTTTGPRSPMSKSSSRAGAASCSPRRTRGAAARARRSSRTASATASSATPAAAPSFSASRRTASSQTASFRTASRACTTAPASPRSPSATRPAGSSTASTATAASRAPRSRSTTRSSRACRTSTWKASRRRGSRSTASRPASRSRACTSSPSASGGTPLSSSFRATAPSRPRRRISPASDCGTTGRNPVTAVRLEGKPIRLMANGVALSGPGAAKIAPGALQDPGAPAPAENGRRIASWAGRAPQCVVIASRPGGERFESSFMLAITGRSHDGGLTTAYSGTLHWSRVNAGDPATIADLVETSPMRGFQKAPEIVLEKSGNGVTLALAFTPIASGPGQISVR